MTGGAMTGEAARRRALVTGATQGIGRAVAASLAARGWDLVVAGRRPGALDEATASLTALGAEVTALEADLARPPDLDRLVEATEGGGTLDLIVHAAGLFSRAPWSETGDQVSALMGVNYEAPARLTGALLPLLVRSRGHVVFVNSTAGLLPQTPGAGAQVGAYVASKAALRALADSLRGEVSRQGVRVTTIFPGSTATPMQKVMHEELGRAYEPDRLMAPEDVAAMVVAVVELPAKLEVSDIIMRPMPPLCPKPQTETSRQ
jgi:short-subunit dehydrogenase